MAKALDLFDYATGEATDMTVEKRAMAPKRVGISPSSRKRKQPRIRSHKRNENNDYTADDIEVLEGLEPVRRHPNRRRLKILGHMRVENTYAVAQEDLAAVELPGYVAQVERIVYIDVVAFDWNCPQHIAQRYTESEWAGLEASKYGEQS